MKIDPEFQALLKPLEPDEYQLLSTSLKSEGCREPLTLWGDILIDGHNRLQICQQHNIPYTTYSMNFESRLAAKLWIIRNQRGRRNLNNYWRGVYALAEQEILAVLGKERMANGGQSSGSPEMENLDSWQLAAQNNHISRGIMSSVKKVESLAPKPIKEVARAGDLTPTSAALITDIILDSQTPVEEAIVKWNLYEVWRAEEIKRLCENGQVGNSTFDSILRTGGYFLADGETFVDFQKVKQYDHRLNMVALSKEHARHAKEAERFQVRIAKVPDNRYRCIVVADKLELAREINIENFAFEGCHLYIWAEHSEIPLALELAAGFKYECLLTQVSPNGISYFSWQHNTRHIIFARKGNLPLDEEGMKLSFEKRSEFYNRVRRASPTPRIILFGEPEEGFDIWGN